MCIPAAGATTHLPTRRRGTWILSLWEAVIELRHIPISKTTSGQVWSPVPHLCGNLPSLLHPTFPLDLTIRMGGSGPRSSYWSLFLMMRIDVDTSAPPLRDEEARIGTAERQYGQYIPHDHPSSSCLLSHDTSTEEQVVPPQWIPELPSRIRSSGTFEDRNVRGVLVHTVQCSGSIKRGKEGETCPSCGDPSCQPPSIASRYSISRYLRIPLPGAVSLAPIPTT